MFCLSEWDSGDWELLLRSRHPHHFLSAMRIMSNYQSARPCPPPIKLAAVPHAQAAFERRFHLCWSLSVAFDYRDESGTSSRGWGLHRRAKSFSMSQTDCECLENVWVWVCQRHLRRERKRAFPQYLCLVCQYKYLNVLKMKIAK